MKKSLLIGFLLVFGLTLAGCETNQNIEVVNEAIVENTVPLGERGNGEAEGIFSDEGEDILSPQPAEQASNSSFKKEHKIY